MFKKKSCIESVSMGIVCAGGITRKRQFQQLILFVTAKHRQKPSVQ